MQEASGDQVLDPVCGMVIERRDAAATRQLGGETYYLCSTSCAEKFDADAAAYVAAARTDGYDKWYGTPPSNGGHAHGTQSDSNPN